MTEKNKQGKRQSNAEKPISLNPLEFDEAVADLLKVKPKEKKPKLEINNKTNERKQV